MFAIRWVLERFDNENPIVRLVRLCVMGSAVEAVSIAIQTLPGIDWPGNYDAVIVLVGTSVLAAADKWLRKYHAVSGQS